jgi:hypothetical protein
MTIVTLRRSPSRSISHVQVTASRPPGGYGSSTGPSTILHAITRPVSGNPRSAEQRAA